jgi:hypothetical protein
MICQMKNYIPGGPTEQKTGVLLIEVEGLIIFGQLLILPHMLVGAGY